VRRKDIELPLGRTYIHFPLGRRRHLSGMRYIRQTLIIITVCGPNQIAAWNFNTMPGDHRARRLSSPEDLYDDPLDTIYTPNHRAASVDRFLTDKIWPPPYDLETQGQTTAVPSSPQHGPHGILPYNLQRPPHSGQEVGRKTPIILPTVITQALHVYAPICMILGFQTPVTKFLQWSEHKAITLQVQIQAALNSP